MKNFLKSSVLGLSLLSSFGLFGDSNTPWINKTVEIFKDRGHKLYQMNLVELARLDDFITQVAEQLVSVAEEDYDNELFANAKTLADNAVAQDWVAGDDALVYLLQEMSSFLADRDAYANDDMAIVQAQSGADKWRTLAEAYLNELNEQEKAFVASEKLKYVEDIAQWFADLFLPVVGDKDFILALSNQTVAPLDFDNYMYRLYGDNLMKIAAENAGLASVSNALEYIQDVYSQGDYDQAMLELHEQNVLADLTALKEAGQKSAQEEQPAQEAQPAPQAQAAPKAQMPKAEQVRPAPAVKLESPVLDYRRRLAQVLRAQKEAKPSVAPVIRPAVATSSAAQTPEARADYQKRLAQVLRAQKEAKPSVAPVIRSQVATTPAAQSAAAARADYQKRLAQVLRAQKAQR